MTTYSAEANLRTARAAVVTLEKAMIAAIGQEGAEMMHRLRGADLELNAALRTCVEIERRRSSALMHALREEIEL